MARDYPTVLDLVGGTPIVRLDRISADVPGTILAKLEYMNPGGSNKDRIGLAMIEAAERDGKLKPGGTIVEPTSGNTGVGLAIAAALKGYRCVFVMPDKMSQEKISMLRAYGAEVVITPTAVDHDSPESYYSVSSRLAEEIPGGSIYTAEDDSEMHPYLVEGIGKDTWPDTIDLQVVDEWIQVSDRESFLMARRLAREEGILAGGSAGSTLWAAIRVAERLPADATVLAIIPDSGRSYMSKFYDDNWMLEHGFVERQAPLPTVDELLRAKHGGEMPEFVTIAAHAKVGEGIDTMQRYGISQLPVIRDGQCESLADVIGSLQDRALLERVFGNPDSVHEDVAAAMQPPLAAVEASATLDEVVATLTSGMNAVVVARGGKTVRVITRSDLLDFLAHPR